MGHDWHNGRRRMGSAAIPARTPRVVTYLVWALLVVLAIGQPAVKGPSMAPSEVIGVHAGTDKVGLQGRAYVAIGDSISAGRFATALLLKAENRGVQFSRSSISPRTL